jgi:hypothetical protein
MYPMSSSNPTSQCRVDVEDAISLTILTPAVNPAGPQEEAMIQSSLETQTHGIEDASGSSSVRSRVQLILTLFALYVRATLECL